MICGNTQAEIDNDTDTVHAENTRFIAEDARWIRTVNDLLAGKEVEGCNLAERMANEYQDFADKVDNGDDFMGEYLSGGFSEATRNIFKKEAKALASIIVG